MAFFYHSLEIDPRRARTTLFPGRAGLSKEDRILMLAYCGRRRLAPLAEPRPRPHPELVQRIIDRASATGS